MTEPSAIATGPSGNRNPVATTRTSAIASPIVMPDNSVARIARASSGPRSGAAGVDHPIDPVLAKVALAIDDDGGDAGTLQPFELFEGLSRLLARAGFTGPCHQVLGVEAGALRGPANGFGLID